MFCYTLFIIMNNDDMFNVLLYCTPDNILTYFLTCKQTN